MLNPLPHHLVDEAIRRALAEDLGRAGDITSAAVIDADAWISVQIAARKPGVIAGLDLAEAAFQHLDSCAVVERAVEDGTRIAPGDVVMRIEGHARGILSAERTALNYLGHLSGIATATRAMADAIAHTKARICDTRKTTPGLRALEKFAVRAGGGVNHRFGLDDAILIKDNHIAAAGGITQAVTRAREQIGHMVVIEVEVDNLDQLDEALSIGVGVILLDNMSNDQLRLAVAANAGRAVLEASGTVTLDRVAGIAETGVDLISSGAITHSAPCLDLGLDFIEAAPND